MSFQPKGKPDRLQMSEIIRRYLSFMATTESLEKGSRESSKGRAQGLTAVVLNEQSNQGKTIIEKLEIEGDAAGAVCLFTADDEGRAKAEQSANPRARQNVVFEAGYFIGRLGRENVAILVDKGIEIPSDLQGVVYTGTDSWEFGLLKELKSMGYSIDFNKMDF